LEPLRNWYDVRVFPFETGISIYFQVTTERKLAQEEREKLIAKLEAANAELERFTYTVSHDLRSPLVTIKGFVGLLEKDIADGDGDRARDGLARIAGAADRMELLLRELLELSRVGRIANPPTSVSLHDVVVEALALTEGILVQRGVEIVLPATMPGVCADCTRLREVLQNLIENAVKYMGDQARPRIEIDAREDRGEVLVRVRDNGMGIEPEYHERVFHLFDKLDREGEGTGIGLALVKRIVEVHGGRVWVESEGSGKGACFCFTLPREDKGP
jgi:signal transduction histidine kinase